LESSSAPGGSSGKPDIQALMADIRARVRADIEKQAANSHRPSPKFYAADGNNQASRRAGDLYHSEDLRYLNQNHDYAVKLRVDSITSHRPGVLGKVIVRFKQKLARMLRYSLFRDYFTSEAEFHVGVVRFLNETATYIDARDGAIFWELIRKIDYDMTKAMERIERINDDQTATLRASERRLYDDLNRGLSELSDRIGLISSELNRQGAELKTLDAVARGLESIAARLSKTAESTLSPRQEKDAGRVTGPDYSYLLLENRYRGSQAEIRERLKIYPPLFAATDKPVLEIGPGRGELLELLKESAVSAYGVDSDPAMVEECHRKGLQVIHGDAVSHLHTVGDHTLGGVIGIQVVEHLRLLELRELLSLCARKVASGGKIIFETVNPSSLSALSSNYFRDPTHVFPLHPDTLSYAMTLTGLKILELKMLSPYPAEAGLREIAAEEYLTPRWVRLIELINYNLRRLNELLYGYQDYCLIAEAP